MATHYFNLTREIRSKQREAVVKFLIEVYQKLEQIARARENYNKVDLEQVVSDIQLFGSSEQIVLAKNIADSISSKEGADIIPLLERLRADLRKELRLDAVDDKIIFLKIKS